MWKKIFTTRVIINTVVLISVVLGVYLPIKITMPLSPEVQNAVHLIENAEPGSTAMISINYAGSSIAETEPIAVALIRLCFLKDVNVIICGFFPEPAQLAEGVISTLGKTYGKKPGEDYLNLGLCYPYDAFILGWGRDYKQQTGSISVGDMVHLDPSEYTDLVTSNPSVESVINSIATTIGEDRYIAAHLLDQHQEELGETVYQLLKEQLETVTRDDWPILQPIDGFGDLLFCADITGTSSYQSWIIWSSDYRDEITYFAGTTAISAPEAYQFLQAEQMISVIPGYRGATEIETYVNNQYQSADLFRKQMEQAGFPKEVIAAYVGGASRGMPSLALVHACILILVLIGNIQYFLNRKKEA
ncbi:MAG: hypothetical protein D6675_11485 [Gemmatimonadetes bacterium]|nr:MAG: hypothetical protein D6675_11485 [Gemmatimonadota bacterium]